MPGKKDMPEAVAAAEAVLTYIGRRAQRLYVDRVAAIIAEKCKLAEKDDALRKAIAFLNTITSTEAYVLGAAKYVATIEACRAALSNPAKGEEVDEG